MGQLGGSPLRGPPASLLGGAALLRQLSGVPEPTYEPDERLRANRLILSFPVPTHQKPSTAQDFPDDRCCPCCISL